MIGKKKDAVTTAYGKLNKQDVVIACFNFNFIGGSMGSAVGEKIARSIDYSRKNKMPLIIISKSGGARMMEASFSLMQLAKTSAKLAELSKSKIPYFSHCLVRKWPHCDFQVQKSIFQGFVGYPKNLFDVENRA